MDDVQSGTVNARISADSRGLCRSRQSKGYQARDDDGVEHCEGWNLIDKLRYREEAEEEEAVILYVLYNKK